MFLISQLWASFQFCCLCVSLLKEYIFNILDFSEDGLPRRIMKNYENTRL